MSLLADIGQTYVAPAAVIRKLAAKRPPERILLGYLLAACLVALAVRLPRQLSNDTLVGDGKMAGFVAANLVAGLIFAPLFLYFLAQLSHWGARLMGGGKDSYAGRLALFWSLFALQPVVALIELYDAYAPTGLPVWPVSGGGAIYFMVVWLVSLYTLETDSS